MDLELRKTGIGGSDVAKILGVSRYGSAFTVYQEKKGLSDGKNVTVAMELGSFLEPYLLQKYCDRVGATENNIQVTSHPEMIRHPEHHFMLAHIDAIVESEGILVELKTSRSKDGWGESLTSDVPLDYLCQVTHYLSVSGLNKAHLFVMFKDTEEFCLYVINKDVDLEKEIIRREKLFWEEHIEKDISPEPVTAEEIKFHYPISNPTTIEADELVIGAIDELKEVKIKINELEKIEKLLKNQITAYVRDNEAITVYGKTIATYKHQSSDNFDIKALKEANLEIYNQYLRTINSRRLLLK